MGLHLGGIGTRIAIFDQDVVAGRPSELLERFTEILKVTLRVRVVLGNSQQSRDPPHSVRLLCARRERPCRRAPNQCDEIAALQPIKLHAVPHQHGPDCRISNSRGSVSGYAGHFATGPPGRCPDRFKSARSTRSRGAPHVCSAPDCDRLAANEEPDRPNPRYPDGWITLPARPSQSQPPSQ